MVIKIAKASVTGGTKRTAQGTVVGPSANGAAADAASTGETSQAKLPHIRDVADAYAVVGKSVRPMDGRPLLKRTGHSRLFSMSESSSDGKVPSYAAWQQAAPLVRQLQHANAYFFSGVQGVARAARFIDTDRRGDYDFSHAYGREAYELWARGEQKIAGIAPGTLPAHLTVENVIDLFHTVFHPRIEKFLPRMSILGRDVVTGSSWQEQPFRTLHATSYTCGPFSDAQISQVQALGCAFIDSPESAANRRVGKVRHPSASASEMRDKLDALVDETREALATPGTDPFMLCAHFIQRFVTLHPFKEANGRSARLWGDAILAHYGIMPPLLDDMNDDLVCSTEELAAKIAAGSARMARCHGLRFDADASEASGFRATLESPSEVTGAYPTLPKADPYVIHNAGPLSYLSRLIALGDRSGTQALPNIAAPTATPVCANGERLAQGPDGFVYTDRGRPHLLGDDGTFVAISDTAYMNLMPFVALGPEPEEMLRALTQDTRQAFARIVNDPTQRASVVLTGDAEATRAENKLQTKFPSSATASVLDIVAPDRIGVDRLFAADLQEKTVLHPVGFVLSRYQQLDLALYHMEKGFSADAPAARDAMRAHRARLFALAKEKIASLIADTGASPADAARDQWLSRAWRASPLRHDTFDDALRADGDSHITLWRGDFQIGRYLGTHPDVNPLVADVLDVGRKFGADAAQKLFASMERHIAQGEGSPWISFTSTPEIMDFGHKQKIDALGSAIFGYATRSAEKDIALSSLSSVARTFVKALPVGKKARLTDPFAKGNLVVVERTGVDSVRITVPRRAFAYRIAKDTAFLAPPNQFSYEQQILVGDGATPLQIHESWLPQTDQR